MAGRVCALTLTMKTDSRTSYKFRNPPTPAFKQTQPISVKGYILESMSTLTMLTTVLTWALLLSTDLVFSLVPVANRPRPTVPSSSVSYVPQQCFLKSEPGQCRASMKKFFFDIRTGQCEEFVYGGCGGNENRFDTFTECHKTCTCATPPETGPCRGHFRRWFYSPEDGCCRPFIYGGCGGNSNNYATWTDCSNQCFFPRANSSWWSWGAEWSRDVGDRGKGGWSLNITGGSNDTAKWNASGIISAGGNRNRSAGAAMGNTSFYSRQDFMRDWHLWGLLLPEGELDMENLASLIAQAHIIGIGLKTGMGRDPVDPLHRGGTSGSGHSANANFQGAGYKSHDMTAMMQALGAGGADNGFGPMYNMANVAGGGNPWQNYGWMPHMDAELEQQRLYGSSYNTDIWGTGNGDQYAGLWANGYGGLHNAGHQANGQWYAGLAGMDQSENGVAGQGVGMQNFGGMHGNQNMAGNAAGATGRETGNNMNFGMTGGQSGSGMADWNRGQTEGNALNTMNTEGPWNSNQGLWNAESFNERFAGVHGSSNTDGHRGGAGATQGNADISQASYDIISMIGSGQLTPAKFSGIANIFGALAADGKVDINILVNRFIQSMRSQPANILNMVSQGLSALDHNGNVDSKLLFQRIESIFRGAIPSTMVTDGGSSATNQQTNQNTGGSLPNMLEGTPLQFAYLISRLASGTLLPSDLSGLAQRFGVQTPSGTVNTHEIARRIVDSVMKQPATEQSLAQLKGIAGTIGAIDSNGKINIDLFVGGLAQKLQPAFANEVLVGRSDGRIFNIEGGKGMGVANIIGIVNAGSTGKTKGTYGK